MYLSLFTFFLLWSLQAPATAVSLFNLDAMRHAEEESKPLPKPKLSAADEIPVLPPTTTTNNNLLLMDPKLLPSLAPSPPAGKLRSPATPIGKLKVPSPASPPSLSSSTSSVAKSKQQQQQQQQFAAESPVLPPPPLNDPHSAIDEIEPSSTIRDDLAASAANDEDGEHDFSLPPSSPADPQPSCSSTRDETKTNGAGVAAESESSLAPCGTENCRPNSEADAEVGVRILLPTDATDGDNDDSASPPPPTANAGGASRPSPSVEASEGGERDAPSSPTTTPVSPPVVAAEGEAVEDGQLNHEPTSLLGAADDDGTAEKDDYAASIHQGSNQQVTYDHPLAATSDIDKSLNGALANNAPAAAIPDDHVLEQFSQQLERLESNFQAERVEMQARFEVETRELREALGAAHREAEEGLRSVIREKDEQLHELARRNEGLKLKMDVLKREVTGTQQLLEAKDGDMGKVSEESQRAIQFLEETLRESQRQTSIAQKQARDVQAKLELAESDFNGLKKEHADLKSRVKAVATELKDRRVECRELKSLVDQRGEENERLEREIESLRFQLSEKDKSGGEKHEEMEQLRAQVSDLKSALEESRKSLKASEEQSERVLSEYKRKAQNSLALANSRAASAVQAKEEAELEARAARSTADSAMERAVAAELSSKAAVAEAKAKVKQMEMERYGAVASMQTATDKLAVVEKMLKETEDKLQEATSMHKQSVDSSKATASELTEAKARLAILEGDLEHSQSRCNSLRDDVATLREQLKRAEAALHAIETEANKTPVIRKNRNPDTDGPSDDATVHILQEDLRDANKAIEDLKDALASSLALNEQYEKTGAASPRVASRALNSDSSSTPLFYAMEKQAELNTARDEIMRLANLLSDVQSEKMEAIELKEDMRRRMEDAEARLERYEKLSHLTTSSAANGAPKDGGSTNIEYLKNIMLRYLNAKTLAEKKALVPVIGAVLCLTPDEQRAAVRNLDESASLGGVGSSLFDTLSSKLR
jgi:hypothetical protein